MKIVIECESFEELFEHVKRIAAGSVWDTPAPAPTPAPAEKEKKTRAKKAETAQALPTAAPAPEPTPEIMPAPVPETPAAPAAPTVTRETCAKAAAMLGRQGTITRDQLRDLITSLGANSIPELPEEKLPDFAAKIRALGGSI